MLGFIGFYVGVYGVICWGLWGYLLGFMGLYVGVYVGVNGVLC